MRNLKLLNVKVLHEGLDISPPTFVSLDTELNLLYLATQSQILALSSTQVTASPLFADVEDFVGFVPVGLEYVCDQQAVCVAGADGKLALWNTSNSKDFECVGEVDGGITAICWSPDMELIVITTGAGQLLLMTREFDVISETSMYPHHQGQESQVALGWGKKETQFHGSVGKAAARTQEVSLEAAADTGEPVISWRGDGQYFVISVVEPSTRARFLYIWSRECVFQAQSQAVSGLSNCLAWRPSGSLIACVRTTAGSQEVLFFEKNGLCHGEFPIPSSQEKLWVKSLKWNIESTVLAVILESNGDSTFSQLQLWTVNNYHWYQKQTLQFEAGIAAALWDTEQANKMHVLTRTGHYQTYTWAWATDGSTGSLDTDPSSVAVIDGARLLLTPLRQMVVPPPMAAYVIDLPHPASRVTFEPNDSGDGLAVLMNNGQIAIYSHTGKADQTGSVNYSAAAGDGFSPQCGLPQLDGIYCITSADTLQPIIVQMLWIWDKQLILTSGSQLYIAHICQQERAIRISHSFTLKCNIVGLALDESSHTVALQLESGQIYKFSDEAPSPWMSELGEPVRFPYTCTEMAVAGLGQETVVLGLTDRFRLYVNQMEICSNCTSFRLHNDFLLLTTFTHTLRCICRSTKLTDVVKLKDGKSHPFDESVRRVERGSHLVAAVANSTKVVLQMPRGNLETIHPRALVLNSLKQLLDRKKLGEAFILMRKHRINLNLLHDHEPKLFFDNIQNLIQEINNPSYLNVFLTELSEEDVTRTMYTATYQRGVSQQTETGSKIDKICDAFLNILQNKHDQSFDQTILTAHVRKSQPDLEKALLVVWSLYVEQKDAHRRAEEALKYLTFLVDVNHLYNVALGTYNFDLVVMVAQNSHKDPKEYIPYLNSLRRLEENYRRYTIDKDLKRFNKALEHISKCGDDHFQECLALVEDHKLYAQAVGLYKPGTTHFKRVATLYGHYLCTKKRHDEAGIMYLKAEEWELALDAFFLACNWQLMFCMASRLEYGHLRLVELAKKMAGQLKDRKMYKDAALVLEEYAKDVEEAIACLIEGSHWEEALHLMYRFKRQDLVETHLKEALEESCNHWVDMLASQEESFLQYKTRLAIVRAQKEKSFSELDEHTDQHGADNDLFSDTSSLTGITALSNTSTQSSRSTILSKTGSARTRRKAANKKWSLKEGSANEEFALVDALAKIIKAIDSLREDTSKLLKMLLLLNWDEKARTVQQQYSQCLGLVETSICQIWKQDSDKHTMLGPASTANTAVQALQAGVSTQEKLDPVLLVAPVLRKDVQWKLHSAMAHHS
ncbi:putative elongator complex protein 1 [Physella acuta]|uniref:putative elongator complex protein 1 n=1 Tax=Physella acuta TaxID=109671 RepID=UPI0027DB7CFE|nr:putative elongator complex protein 1 [Physella acuta]XP_059175283.1 putative elongator complex protein 1 [Physella acuta]